MAQVTIPDLVGQKSSDALETLEATGLTASVNEVPSNQETDLVVAQSPSGGTKVDKSSSVTLNVSKGRPATKPQPVSITVPNVVGESKHRPRSARSRSAGLQPSTQHVPSTQEKGTVVSQSPVRRDERAEGRERAAEHLGRAAEGQEAGEDEAEEACEAATALDRRRCPA